VVSSSLSTCSRGCIAARLHQRLRHGGANVIVDLAGGNNVPSGLDGNDTSNGGAGNDTLDGAATDIVIAGTGERPDEGRSRYRYLCL
jgi:hypothetical protein